MTSNSSIPRLMLFVMLAAPVGYGAASDDTASLVRQIAATREQYFTLYNRLNTVPRYEMVCRDRFHEPSCKPRFMLDALQKGRTLCPSSMSYSADFIADVCNPAIDRLKAATATEEAEYLRHVARIVGQNEQLLAIGARLQKLLALQRSARD
jgi:hypothetical protein